MSVALLLMCLGLYLSNPDFLGQSNSINTLRQISMLGIFATGKRPTMAELGRWFDALWADSVDVSNDVPVELYRVQGKPFAQGDKLGRFWTRDKPAGPVQALQPSAARVGG